MYYGGDDLVTYDQLTEAASYLRHAIGDVPDIAFILGSGLGHMADVIENPVYVDYGDIPHFPVSTEAASYTDVSTGKRSLSCRDGSIIMKDTI